MVSRVLRRPARKGRPFRALPIATRCAALAMVLTVLAIPQAAADDPTVEAAADPGGPAASELTIVLEPGAESGELDFFLRQSGSEPIKGATVAAVGDLEVDVAAASGQTLTVPPAGGAALVTATVTKVIRPIDTRVPLYLTLSNGTSQPLVTLRVVRADAPALTVVGAENGAIAFEQDRAAFRRDLVLRSDSAAGVRAVVSYTPLQHSSSIQTPLDVLVDGRRLASGTTIEIPGRGRRTLTLAAELTRSGSYATTLALSYGRDQSSQLDTMITVTRTATKQTIVADEVNAARAVRGPCLDFWRCIATGTTDVTFRETEGETAAFDSLQVREVVIDDAGTNMQAGYTNAAVQVRGSGEDASNGFVIAPRSSRVITAKVEGLTRAGKYEIRLRGSTPGAPPVDVTARLLVRDPMIVAGLLILAGVILSWAIRRWLTHSGPRLAARIRFDELGARLDEIIKHRGEPADTRRAMIEGMRAMLSRAASRADRGGDPANSTAAAADLETRIELLDQWLDVANTADRQGNSRVVANQLDAASAVLLAPAALGDADRNAFDTAIAQARELLDDDQAAMRAKEVERLLAEVTPLGFKDADWDTLRNEVSALAGGATDPAALKRASYDQYQLLLRRLATSIKVELVSRQGSFATSHPSLADEFGSMADSAEQVAEDAALGRLQAAQTAYTALLAQYEKVLPKVNAAGGTMSGPGPGRPVPLLKLPVASAHQPTARGQRKGGTWRRLRQRGTNAVVFLIFSVITVAAGIATLYLPNNVWGTPLDYITAFFWGLGFSQLGGAASEGIDSLRRKYSEPASA